MALLVLPDATRRGTSSCSGCHTRVLPDGSLLNGAPFDVPLNAVTGELVTRGTPSSVPGDSLAIANWREFTVPWIRNDIHDSIRSMTEAEAGFMFGSIPPGAFARFHGSPC